MPELPEVATIKSQLSSYLPLKIKSMSKSSVVDSILHTKVPDLKGCHLESITRHGKCLIFQFDKDIFLLSHLGMTGSWRISEKKNTEKHNHFSFKCENYYLSYVDPRRFGHMYFFDITELNNYLKRLGPDLLSKDFTPSFILEKLKKYTQREIKPFLLEQKFFAGSGNYIANEVCALAKIHPQTKCGRLNLRHAKKIHKAFLKILTNSIENQGVTFQGGYTDAFGDKGKGVQNLVVFHQKLCGMCKKTEIRKITLKQRGTFYCPKCQPLEL